MNGFLKHKKIFAVIVIAVAALCAALLFFGGNKTATAVSVDDNYRFKKIHTEISVNRDKTFNIRETLEAEFFQSGINTGIIRDIQRESKTTRIIDGKKKGGRRYLAKLENVCVTLDGGDARVTRSLYGAFHAVKMQKPDAGYLSAGIHTFVLSYTYDMSDDSAYGYDDFTFDALGYAMAETIQFTAEITFPSDADLSRVSFRTNNKAAWYPDTEKGEYATVSANKISIRAYPFAAEKGYTVQVILPDGYFTQKLTFYSYYLIFFGIAVLGIALYFVILFAGRIHKKVIAPVEYLPPDIGIMRFSAVWHNGARYKDIGALILKWAAEGLVTVEADGKRNFRVIPDESLNDAEKRKEVLYDMDFAERNFFESMFLAGKLVSFSTKAFKKRRHVSKRRVYEGAEKLVERANDPKPCSVSAATVSNILPFVALIPTVALILFFAVLLDGWLFLFFVAFMAAGTLVGCVFNNTKNLLMLIFPLMFYGGLYFFYVFIFAYTVYDYAGLAIIAPLWWAVGLFVLPRFANGYRTKKTNEEYTKIYGFRQFLLYTELDRIQLVFEEHPDYFTQILPYCYIMGISKKIKKRFASLDFIQPEYMSAGLDPEAIVCCTSHTFHHISVNVSMGGGGGGGSGGGGGGGGSSGGGGGGGGSRGC